MWMCMCVCCTESLLVVGNRQNGQKPTEEKTEDWLLLCHWLPHMLLWLPMQYGWLCFFGFNQHSTNLSSGQSYSLAVVNRCITKQAVCTCECFLLFPTLVASPMFDDNGPSAACLLLSLGHALTSLIVRVICSVDCHLLLNHPKTWQLLGSTGWRRREDSEYRQWSDRAFRTHIVYFK